MSGPQVNNILIQNLSAPFVPRTLEDSDILDLTPDVILRNNLTVQGVLTAEKLVTIETEEIRTEANHIFLNDGYITPVAQSAGLTANYLPTATNDTVATGGFTAGVVSTTDPRVITTAASTFAAGAVILITGANQKKNDGLYEVENHATNNLDIRGIGLNPNTAGFFGIFDDDFETDSTVAGTITLINIAIMRAGVDGLWETAEGNNTGSIVFTDLGSGAGNSLQQAYVQGNTITTSAGEGLFIVNGDQSLQLGGTVLLDVNTAADFDVNQFDVDVTGAGYSLDADTASNVSVTAAGLTISTITSGTLLMSAAGLMDLDALAGFDLDVTGALDMLASGVFSLDGTGASNVSATSGALTVSTLVAGNLVLLAADDVDLDGTNVVLTAVTLMDIDGTTVNIDASGAFSLDGGAASNVTVTAANLTLSTLTSGDVIINAVGDFNGDAVNILLDATAGMSFDAAAASNVSVTGADLTLSTITSGGLLLISADASTYTVPNATAAALTLTDGSTTYLVVDSVDDELELTAFVNLSLGSGIRLTADATIAVGELVQVISAGGGTGRVDLADANTGNLTDALVVGVAVEAGSAGNPFKVFTTPGNLIPMLFSAAPAAANNGDRVYLGTTPGEATLTAPTGNSTTTFAVGILQGADGADTTPNVIFQPAHVSSGAQVT